MEDEEKSEFGEGLTYCLGLFLCHSERGDMQYGIGENTSLWFNGAADHLYGLEIPDFLPNTLKKSLEEFKEKCLNWRLNPATGHDKKWAINKAKSYLLKIDKHFKINTTKAEWD